MLNAQYQLYLESVFSLAETLTVKLHAAALAVNEGVTRQWGAGAVDTTDPSSWKYYQNMAGQYHASDTVMHITSLDDLSPIEFRPEVLAQHPQTRAAYRYGTRYYRALVLQYPQQEALILGVLYPADLATAVAAVDGTIVSHAPEFIETQEYSLLYALNRWSQRYVSRWMNLQYTLSDDLYLGVALSQWMQHATLKILNLRLQACKTNEAHSFHMRQYLASHQGLDRYWDVMTPAQRLFLYRNLPYLERHAGQQATFEWLVQAFFTERGLPLQALSLHHDTAAMLGSYTPEAERWWPQLQLRAQALNPWAAQQSQSPLALSALDEELDAVAGGNARERADSGVAMVQALQQAPSAALPTKLLYSSVVETEDAFVFALADILVQEWVAQACDGSYQARLSVALPGLSDARSFTVREALVLAVYAWAQAAGMTLTALPQLQALRVVPPIKVDYDAALRYSDRTYCDPQALAALYALQPVRQPCTSTQAFYVQCRDFRQAINAQYQRLAQEHHQHARAAQESFVRELYATRWCDPREVGQDLSYAEWFSSRQLLVADYSAAQWWQLYQDLLASATGANLYRGVSAQALQSAMGSLLTTLSSYSVLLLQDAQSATRVPMLPRPELRVGEVTVKVRAGLHAPLPEIRATTCPPAVQISDVALPLLQTSAATAGRYEAPHDALYRPTDVEPRSNVKTLDLRAPVPVILVQGPDFYDMIAPYSPETLAPILARLQTERAGFVLREDGTYTLLEQRGD